MSANFQDGKKIQVIIVLIIFVIKNLANIFEFLDNLEGKSVSRGALHLSNFGIFSSTSPRYPFFETCF